LAPVRIWRAGIESLIDPLEQEGKDCNTE